LALVKLADDNQSMWPQLLDVTIELNGEPVPMREWNNFAVADGFGCVDSECWFFKNSDVELWPFVAMTLFWLREHGPRAFQGVLLRWEDRS
jgi:hypothetical protein